MDLTIVVPCYNEEEVLSELLSRVLKVSILVNISYELILVNDGSRDRTWSRMEELRAGNPHIILVNLSRNFGHQIALTAGLELSRGQMILIIDADLQDPPELLPEMIRIMKSGVDVVYGKRRRREGEGRFKLLTASLFYRTLDWISETPIPRDAGDFRLISRRALDTLLSMPEKHRFLRGMVSWIGLRQEPLVYDRHARFAGKSKYSLRKMLRLCSDAITSCSTKPLLLTGYLGVLLILLGNILLLDAIFAWWLGQTDANWLGLLAYTTMLGGFQLAGIGIMSMYLRHIFTQTQGRPLFVIQDIVGIPSEFMHGGMPSTKNIVEGQTEDTLIDTRSHVPPGHLTPRQAGQ